MARTIVLDFDGVLHSYTSGWKGAEAIPDPPTPGAQDFVRSLQDAGYTVVICSTRAESPEGADAMAAWLYANDFPDFLGLTHGKPPALVYLDDRALRFDGEWPDMDALEAAAIPWNKRETA